MNHKYFIKFRKTGSFYSVYNDDAYVIAYIMKYKLVYIDENNIKTGFPIYLLDEVLYYLNKNKISYVVLDNPVIFKDYKNENRYLKFLHKNQSIDSIRFPNSKKEFKGNFKVLFLDENEIQNFVIGENINSDAEIVSKVFDNDIGSVVTLNSGIQFKIISKNIV